MDLSVTFTLQPYYPYAVSHFVSHRTEVWPVLTSVLSVVAHITVSLCHGSNLGFLAWIQHC